MLRFLELMIDFLEFMRVYDRFSGIYDRFSIVYDSLWTLDDFGGATIVLSYMFVFDLMS